MERGFLSQKRSEVGRGVKEKQGLMADKLIEVVKYGVVPSATVAYGNIQKDLNDDLVEMEVQSLSVDLTNAVKTGRGSYPPLPTQGTTPTRNTPGKSSYANVIGESSKFGLVKSMLNSSTRLFSFQFSSMDGLNSMLENGPWFIRNHPLILRKWNSDVDHLKEDVWNVPVWVKLH
ncbi:ankyrin repeat family protein, partial [Tanacetum coccineum]